MELPLREQDKKDMQRLDNVMKCGCLCFLEDQDHSINICWHFYNKCSTYDSLGAAVRKVEIEHQPLKKKSAITKYATPKEESQDRSTNYRI